MKKNVLLLIIIDKILIGCIVIIEKLSKLLALFLAVIMALSVLWIPAAAEEKITVNVSLDKDTYTATATWTPVSGAKTYTFSLRQENPNGQFISWDTTRSIDASAERTCTFPSAWFCYSDIDNWKVFVYAENAPGKKIGEGSSDVFHSGVPERRLLLFTAGFTRAPAFAEYRRFFNIVSEKS